KPVLQCHRDLEVATEEIRKHLKSLLESLPVPRRVPPAGVEAVQSNPSQKEALDLCTKLWNGYFEMLHPYLHFIHPDFHDAYLKAIVIAESSATAFFAGEHFDLTPLREV